MKWHCSSECNTVTEAEVAAIVHLKQAFEDASHPIHPNTTLHFILMTSTTPSIILLVPIVHILPYICNIKHHNTSLYTIKHPTCAQTQNNPTSEIYRPTPLIITSTLHNTPNPFMPSPQKNAPKQVTEKALSKKCRNRSCRDALPAKKHFPKNQ